MNKLIIPVLVKNAQMPDFSKLPASIGALQWRNSAIIRRQPDLKNDCQRLADGIKQYLESIAPSDSDTVGTGLALSKTEILSAILPQPFDLIAIPNKDYSIGKYPVTNAQFAKFVEADGYNNKAWWTEEGWQKCQEGWHYDGGWKVSGMSWTQPRYWQDSKWNGANYPVVGVSWFEAVAFCLWLSDVTGKNIMLPTEPQWQRAAGGDEELTYPWGNNWDCERCNNSVKPCNSYRTTPVTQYDNKANRLSSVLDMAGNVWEWCLTDYDNKVNDITVNAKSRVLRGGSWDDSDIELFRCDYRLDWNPHDRCDNYGFRFLLSHTSS